MESRKEVVKKEGGVEGSEHISIRLARRRADERRGRQPPPGGGPGMLCPAYLPTRYMSQCPMSPSPHVPVWAAAIAAYLLRTRLIYCT